ncbi:MAG: permease [Desulfotomaculum sp. BICA1-6]|nr:MAG: permease [Peptococcaceae bacterium BRH_c8a]KJS75275.1 MAG: permease [Desulfotomaculum sp. BICA1-6]
MSKQYYTGVSLVFVSAIGFGLLPIFALYAYQGGVNVTTLLLLRFSLAAVCYFVLVLINKVNIKLDKNLLVLLFVMGSIFYMLQSNFYLAAVQYIPASVAVLIFYTHPIFVAVLSLIFYKESLTGNILISILISIIGLTMVLGSDFGGLSARGLMLAGGAALVYSCYIVLGQRVLKQLPVMVASLMVTMFASFSLLAIGIATDSLNFNMQPMAWMALAGMVAFSTVLSVFTFFRGISLIGSTKASILSMVEPLTTIGFSALLFGERMSWLQLAGGLAVLAGSLLVITAEKKPVGAPLAGARINDARSSVTKKTDL